MLNSLKRIFYKDDINESIFITIAVIAKLKFLHRSTRSIIEKRKGVNLFQYNTLAESIPYYPYHLISENDRYGHGKWLFNKLKYSSLQKSTTRIEHGLQYHNDIVQPYKINDFAKSIITLSENRIDILKEKTNKEIIAVGPYILYADEILSKDEFDKLKEQLGKTLLVFPTHSIDAIHSSYDIDDLIDKIKAYRNQGYKSIIICMYWKDIQLGRAEKYIKEGFKIVTAGHTYDYYFLSRLKSIIQLSDYTISNSVGTHVGYCIALHKPHYIIKSEVSYITGDNELDAEKEFDRMTKHKISFYKMKDEIEEAFQYDNCSISKYQRNIIEKYWGKSKVHDECS